MGVVYHCRDTFLQRDVAIKMLLPELLKDSNSVKVFTQEAQLAAHLEHPNIVTVYDIGVEERDKQNHHFVAMEHLPGGTLANRTQNGALPIEHALNWMKQLANGLNFAHRRGVVHQDIKADNILITIEGDVKIGDFGLARLMANKVYINPSTKGMGTPAYMSPELCRGEQQDHRSDIYSLGVLFFEMATGQLPYRASGMIEMAMKHTTAPIPSVRRINPRVPDALDRLIRRMMEKSPDDRFQSLGEVLSRLDDFIFELRVARMGLQPELGKTPDSPEEFPGKDAEDEKSDKDRGVIASTTSPSEQAKVDTEPEATKQPEQFEPPEPKETRRADRQSSSAVGGGMFMSTAPPTSISASAGSVDESAPEEESTKDKKNAEAPSSSGAAVEAQDAGRKGRSADISQSKILAAGIRLPQEVGPAREPTREIKLQNPRTSAYEIPVIEGLSPILLEKWKFSSGGPIGWASRPLLSSDERYLYVASSDGKLYKLDTGNGVVVWSYDSESLLLSSPVLKGKDIWQTAADGSLIKINDATGERVWRRRLSGRIVSSPVMMGSYVYTATKDGIVSAVDSTTGDVVWEYATDAAVVANPSIYGDIILVGTRGGSMYCFDGRSGKRQWKSELDGAIVAAPATSVDSFYVGTQAGTFYSLDIETGQPLWEHQAGRGIISSAQIIFTSVVFCSQDKWLYCCEKYDGSLRWKAAVRGNVQAALCVAARSIVATSREGWMQAFDEKSGDLRWQRNFGKRLESTPLIMKDALVLANVEGVVTYYVFNSDQLGASA